MNEISSKLKLILWGKRLQLPENYDNLEFDNYKLKIIHNIYGYDLYIYKNNKIIKRIWYYNNGNKGYEQNFKNGKQNGKEYSWYSDGELSYENNYKNGKEI